MAVKPPTVIPTGEEGADHAENLVWAVVDRQKWLNDGERAHTWGNLGLRAMVV